MKSTSISRICALALPLFAVSAVADVFSDIRDNNVESLKSILAANPSAAVSSTERGVTPLDYAIVQRRFEAAFELLAAGADPNSVTASSLVTPLHRAADKGDVALVRLLLENKANPSAAAATGFTALHFAARTNAADCVALLLNAGAPVEAADANGRTALHIAAKYDAAAAAAKLVGAGASLDAKDKFGYIPAALASDPDLVEALGGALPSANASGAVADADPAVDGESASSVSGDDIDIDEPADEPVVGAPVDKWDDNPFHDESLDPAARIRRFHADSSTRILPDGRSYWGGVSHDKFEGFGVLLDANERDRYEGRFHRGMKNGFGTFYYANGDVFSGEFKDDAPEGEGEFVFANGGTVTGTWKRGLMWQGRGTFTVSSGAKFTGSWDGGELVASRPID